MVSVQQKARWVLWYWELKSVIKVQRHYHLEYGGQSIKHCLE